MKGDRVEAVVDTGQGGTQTFEIVAATRVVALVEHSAAEGRDRAVEVSTRRRMGAGSADE